MIRVLFVCLGNICRSPSAERVFRHQVLEAGLEKDIQADSAATSRYQLGDPADARSARTAAARGYDLSGHCARQIQQADFERYDYIVAMDNYNDEDLRSSCPQQYETKISLLMQYAPQTKVKEVPDPYAGGQQGFERVLDLIEAGCKGLLNEITKSYALQPAS